MFNKYMYKVNGKIAAISDKNGIEEKENHQNIEEYNKQRTLRIENADN